MPAKKKILVLGIGNPLMQDDAVGIITAEEISRLRDDVEIKTLATTGIDVIEETRGFDKVIIVDSFISGERQFGRILKLHEKALDHAIYASTPHDINLPTAIALGKKLFPDSFPKEISIFALEIKSTTQFGAELTPEVKKGLPNLLEAIMEELDKDLKE